MNISRKVTEKRPLDNKHETIRTKKNMKTEDKVDGCCKHENGGSGKKNGG